MFSLGHRLVGAPLVPAKGAKLMEEEPARYRSYLLRLWRVEGDEPAWRASLEEPRTGERRAFPELEALFAYLQEELTFGPATARKEPTISD